MKIIAIILSLLVCLSAGATGDTQTVTLEFKDAPLEVVLKALEKQSTYYFFCDAEILRATDKVTIQVRDVPVLQALEMCLKEHNLTYTIMKRTIIITKAKKGEPSKEKTVSDDQEAVINVKGKVTNSTGEPVSGATIAVLGTKKTTVSNASGDFFLNEINDESIIVITHVEYESMRIAVNGKSMLKAVLQTKVGTLDEMQVIAYGTTTKRMNTGNVSTVKASDIEKQPVSNPLLALEGRVPGLFISQASGFAGSGVKVRIQGVNSIAGGNDPLYVVDGVPYVSQLLPSISTTLGSSGGLLVENHISFGNPLSYINPTDIESIEVLKDADATAIYGSRAANGAVLITTKKGKAGEQKIEFILQQGWGKVTRRMDMLNLRQYLDMRYEALRNDGIDLRSAPANTLAYSDLKVWDTTRYTDWQKELIGNTAHYTDLQATISGGTATSSYSIGTGYHRETTVLPMDFHDQKGSVHFQINSNSANQKFRLRFNGNYMVDVNKLPHNVDGTDITLLAFQLPPNAPALYNPDGSINWAPDANGNTTWRSGNPIAHLLNKYENRTNNLVGDALLSYQLIPGLQIKSSFGYNSLITNETGVEPLSSTPPELRANIARLGIYGNNNINSWVIEPQVTYEKVISKGRLETLIGSSIQQRNSEGQKFRGFGYATDDVIDDIHAASSIINDWNIKYTYKYNAAFGRITYTWKQKYIVNFTGRRDGSSRFGSQNRFHNFGSVAGAWIFSEEKIITDFFKLLSFGKIKGSYGTTGNDQIGDYQYLSTFSPVAIGNPYQGLTALQSNGIANPYLQWEETRKLNVGLDFGLYKDKVLISANYFLNRSSNQLLTYPLPATTGFRGITQNFPATVQNSGWEFSVSTNNWETKKFKWSTTFNLTIHKNKLVAFPDIESSSYANLLIIGEPITIVKRLHLIGVDPSTGVYYFDSKLNPFAPKTPDDAHVVIDPSPKFYGGLQNTIRYKEFQFDCLFQFVKQKGANYSFGRFPGGPGINQPAYILGRWEKPGDKAAYQRFNSNSSLDGPYLNAASFSDASFDDASYIRLKNLSVSWQLPERLLRTTHLHGLRIFTQGQNLLTFTKYKGLDPETMSAYSLPPLRVLTVGVQVTL